MWAERSEAREEGDVAALRRRRRSRRRGSSSSARSTSPPRCARSRAPPAGGRSWSTRAGASRSKERFPDAEEVFVGWPEEAFAALGGIDRATSIAVLTHDPKLDDAALEIALRSEAAYIGAMGSRRAQAKRRDRLVAKGITDEELARLSAPIGLDLGALTRGGDGAVDHERDRRPAPRPAGRAARARARAASTR